MANDGGGELLLGPRGLRLLQLAHQQLRAHPRGAEWRLDLVRHPVEHLFTKAVARSVSTRFAPPLLDLRNRHRWSERLLHRRLELVHVHRLGQERVRLVQALRARRAHQQERDRGPLRGGAQRTQQLDPGPPRHHVGREEENGARRVAGGQRLSAILCRPPPGRGTTRRRTGFPQRTAIGRPLKSPPARAISAPSLKTGAVPPATPRRVLSARKNIPRRSTSATDSSSAPRPSITSRRAPSR